MSGNNKERPDYQAIWKTWLSAGPRPRLRSVVRHTPTRLGQGNGFKWVLRRPRSSPHLSHFRCVRRNATKGLWKELILRVVQILSSINVLMPHRASGLCHAVDVKLLCLFVFLHLMTENVLSNPESSRSNAVMYPGCLHSSVWAHCAEIFQHICVQNSRWIVHYIFSHVENMSCKLY